MATTVLLPAWPGEAARLDAAGAVVWPSLRFPQWDQQLSLHYAGLLWTLHTDGCFSHCDFTCSPIFLTEMPTGFAKNLPFQPSSPCCEVLDDVCHLCSVTQVMLGEGRAGRCPGCETSGWLYP